MGVDTVEWLHGSWMLGPFKIIATGAIMEDGTVLGDGCQGSTEHCLCLNMSFFRSSIKSNAITISVVFTRFVYGRSNIPTESKHKCLGHSCALPHISGK